MIITIVGVGLIGGSAAIDLRSSKFGTQFIGVDKNEEHCKEAIKLGLVDKVMPLKDAVEHSDLVIVTLPVDATCSILPQILTYAGSQTVVTDMGSTKSGICLSVANHPNRQQYVASHPIAGTEFSGPSAAIANLFSGKKTIICEKELSSPSALKTVEEMYENLNMEIIYMPANKHDKHIAFVSHISHISSFALGLTVLNIEKDESSIFNMAGSGFGSTVRLAKSSPSTWTPIFMQNAKSISYALADYIKQLEEFKESIDNEDAEKLTRLMEGANRIKKIIK